jgi:hypothetical protein
MHICVTQTIDYTQLLLSIHEVRLVLTRQVHFHAPGMPAVKRESPNLSSIHEWYIVYCHFLSKSLLSNYEVESDSAMKFTSEVSGVLKPTTNNYNPQTDIVL